jgi:proteasome lid subunit RPN8/RPN11
MTRPVVHLSEDLRRRIIDHCLAGLPNEACGLLAMEADRIAAVYPTSNQDESPSSYTIPPQEHFDALTDAEARGWRIGGVFHSHPQGPATMSSIDVARALEPDWVYMVIGLAGEVPEVAMVFGADLVATPSSTRRPRSEWT